MAVTESSAIARFVDSVRNAPIIGARRREIEIPRHSTDILPSNALRPIRRSRIKLLFVGLLMAGVVAGGVYLVTSGAGIELLEEAKAIAGIGQADSQAAAVPNGVSVTPGETAPAETAPAVTAAVVPAVEEEDVAAVPAETPTVTPVVARDAGVDIIVEPPGSRVFLDGKEIGQAPLRVSRLTPGDYVIDIEAVAGYSNKQVSVTLESGRSRVVKIELETVSMGGVIVSPIPSTKPTVTPIREAAPRAVAPVRRAPKRQVRRPQPRKHERKMVAVRGGKGASTSSASGKTGTLMIGAKPSCKIYIDGKYTGKRTPQRAVRLSAGRHDITLVNDQYDIKKKLRVDIKPGQTSRIVKNLTSQM